MKSITTKLLLVILPIILVISGFNAVWAYWSAEQEIEEQANRSFDVFRRMMEHMVASKAQDLAMASRTVQGAPAIQEAFAERDRAKLADLTMPLFEDHLRDTFGIRFFQFHTPPATSFLRVNMPDAYGDDLSGWRQTVVDANEEQATMAGLEVVRFGLALVATVPVRHKGEHIGTVEMGRSARDLFRGLGEQTGLAYAIGIRDQVFADANRLKEKAVDQHRGDLTFYSYSSEKTQALLDGVPANGMGGRIEREGRVYATGSIPVTDYSGKEVGRIALFKDITATQASALSALWTQLGVVAVAAVGVLLLFRALAGRLVVRPIRAMEHQLEDIASGGGDLTQRLPSETADEVGRASDAFNRLMAQLQDQMRTSREQSSQLAAASEQLSNSADELQRSADHQRTQTEQVASSSQEVNQVVQDVASNINEVSRAANRVNEQGQEGAEAAEQADQKMQELRQTTNKVNAITESIQSIAKKTDLLALNAAIEAANAGEAGQGFAVVADEVRKLAEQTASATAEIDQILGQFHSQVDDNAANMDRLRNAIAGISEQAESTDQMANQIASAAEELAATMSENTDHMHEIQDSVASVTSAAAQIGQAASQVDRMANQVAEEVARFRVD